MTALGLAGVLMCVFSPLVEGKIYKSRDFLLTKVTSLCTWGHCVAYAQHIPEGTHFSADALSCGRFSFFRQCFGLVYLRIGYSLEFAV